MFRRLFATFLLVSSTAVVVAQLPSPLSRFGNLSCLAPIIRQVDPLAPKNIGEALVLPPYREALSGTGIGPAQLQITTGNALVQQHFNRGIALLHALWSPEAERSFRHAASLQPDHPMPYFGMALANEAYPGRARIYIDYARHLTGSYPEISARERSWIDLYHRYYAATPEDEDDLTRRQQRIGDLEDHALRYPDEIEARAFLMRELVLDEFRAGVAPGSRFAIATLGDQIERLSPGHPAAHYRTLLWLPTRPQRAAETAWQAAQHASASPGSWGLAAEALAAAGNWPHAMTAHEHTVRAANAHLLNDLATPDAVAGYVSAVSARIEALIATGQTDSAVAAATNLIHMPRSAYLDDARSSFAIAQRGSYLSGRRLLAQAFMTAGRWQTMLAACEAGGPLAADERSENRAHSLCWQSIAHAQLDQHDAAREAQDELENLFRDYLRSGKNPAIEAEIKSAASSLRNYRQLLTGEQTDATKSPPVLLHIPPARLAMDLASGGHAKAALILAKNEWQAHPQHPLNLAVAAGLQFQHGDRDAARLAVSTDFRRNAALADSSHPLLRGHLGPLIEHLKLRGNWTLPSEPAPAVADEFPAPVLWSPPIAPAWTLPGPDGKSHALADYRDKPVVVIFFVGLGCPFCVEQLKVFEPHAERYQAAGIPIVTISSDPQETLAAMLGTTETKAADKPAFPFPVFSDAEQKAFRRYRCFDHFDNKPMHGLFLIDPKGRLLWSNVGHEPFMHPEFLLQEAQRLLSVWN